MNDEHLLDRLKRKDPKALERLIHKYSAYVLTVSRNRSRHMLSEQDVEEIASDVFLALWNRANEIHSCQLRSWLGSTARNKTIDRLRQQNLNIPLDETTLVLDNNLWQNMAREEQVLAVQSALATLSDEDQELFFRYYTLCQTSQEIADHLGTNASTVRTRLSRGRQKLKEYLCKGGFTYETYV